MFESIISLLIYACFVAIAVYLVIWVLGIIGIAIPAKVVQLLWVVCVLIIVLMAARILLPMAGHGRLLGNLMLPLLA